MPQRSYVLNIAKMEYHLQSWNLVADEEKGLRTSFTDFIAK